VGSTDRLCCSVSSGSCQDPDWCVGLQYWTLCLLLSEL
jgi:hypothetical protein